MTIKTYEENGITVVAPEGKIDHVTAAEFENKATEAAEACSNSLMIDMAGVEYISSAALRAILQINSIMEKRGGLILKNVNNKVMEIFRITGIGKYLDIR